MAGQIRRMIDVIIETRSGGNAALVNTTRTKLILKGINPDKFGAADADDPVILEKVRGIAQELGVAV